MTQYSRAQIANILRAAADLVEHPEDVADLSIALSHITEAQVAFANQIHDWRYSLDLPIKVPVDEAPPDRE